MRFGEKSAWAMVATLAAAYGWYLSTVFSQMRDDSVEAVAYQRTAIIAVIAVVVLAAITHILFAATDSEGSRTSDTVAVAIRRYTRSVGGVVVTAAAVLAMALSMTEAHHFWISNVVMVGLVLAELTSSGMEILIYRRGA